MIEKLILSVIPVGTSHKLCLTSETEQISTAQKNEKNRKENLENA